MDKEDKKLVELSELEARLISILRMGNISFVFNGDVVYREHDSYHVLPDVCVVELDSEKAQKDFGKVMLELEGVSPDDKAKIFGSFGYPCNPELELEKAANILSLYNSWRRSECELPRRLEDYFNVTELGKAIDTAIFVLKNLK